MPRDTILFDINETVLDLSSLKPKFERLFGDATLTSVWFTSLLHNSTVCILTGIKTGFADLAGIMLDNLAAKQCVTLSADQRADVLATLASLKPHNDIRPAMETLNDTGYRCVAFSNSSSNLIEKQIRSSGLGDLFHEIISVEETESFKPDPKVYRYGAEMLNRSIEDLRLIATHDWDTHGAMTAGMQAAYIDRSGAPYHPLFKKPDIIATSMEEVVRQIIQADQI